MKVYISGPINGRENGNRAAFNEAMQSIIKLGLEPVNPHLVAKGHAGHCRGEEVGTDGHGYGCYMKPDLIAMLECDAVVFLPGWKYSKGATVEHAVAQICGLAELRLEV